MAREICEMDKIIGKTIRFLRISRNITQGVLAKELGITFQQIQKYEKGLNKVSASSLFKLSEFFGVEINFFFDFLKKNTTQEYSLRKKANKKAFDFISEFGMLNKEIRNALLLLIKNIRR
jgi:transcriptional regulator with XRE-family HTH domain